MTALERKALQQYLSARQQRNRAAAQHGGPVASARFTRSYPSAYGAEGYSGKPMTDSLEAELLDLERHWEDLERATAQDKLAAQGLVCRATHTPCFPV